MYHYVRPIADSRYPRIRGLELHDFEGQLDYIQTHYNVVSMEEVLSGHMPSMPLLLTFDDGYLDHYEHVFPALKRRGMHGVFFPPACAVHERTILDVNKIHFILANAPDDLTDIIALLEKEVEQAKLKPVSEYRAALHKPNRFDTADTIYVKRMLQFALPLPLRQRLTAQLFAQHVSDNEKAFADTLYLSEAQLKEMIAAGMTVGSHGYAHPWLDSLSTQEQQSEIDHSLQWLASLGVDKERFTFCYPYGAYNADTLELLKKHHCAAAFTTKVGLARPATGTMLELPRIDTNDLPCRRDAAMVEWTTLAQPE